MRAYGMHIFLLLIPPASEMAGYHQWSLRDPLHSTLVTEGQ
jgi:hypothetical protein